MTDHDPLDELVAGLRTDVREMSDAAFEAGRSRLLARIDPEPEVTALTQDPAVVPLTKRRSLRSPSRRLVTVAAAAAAVVALAAGALLVQAARHDDTPTTAAAAQLNDAADNVQPDEPIGPDQYRYTASRSWHAVRDKTGKVHRDMSLLVMVGLEVEQWVPGDPTRECAFHVTNGDRKYLIGDAELAELENLPLPEPGSDDYTRACDKSEDRGWVSPTPELLASLPRDPVQLHDRLRDDKERMRDYSDDEIRVAASVNTLLMSGVVPADLRAALYRALAMTPGLTIIEQVADLDGRQGTAFGLRQGDHRLDIIINTATGQYVGSRWVLEGSQPPPGTAVPAGTVQESVATRDLVLTYTTLSDPVLVTTVGERR
jgi:hypothetical protein